MMAICISETESMSLTFISFGFIGRSVKVHENMCVVVKAVMKIQPGFVIYIQEKKKNNMVTLVR